MSTAETKSHLTSYKLLAKYELYMCVYVCTRVCVCACTLVYVYVLVCVFIFIQAILKLKLAHTY